MFKIYRVKVGFAEEFLGFLAFSSLGVFGFMPILLGIEHNDTGLLVTGIFMSLLFGCSVSYFWGVRVKRGKV